jgi:prolyl-tRNA synthetase
VATPGCTTIDDLCRFLGVERCRTAKAVFRVADEEMFVFAVVRGDRDLSEAKLLRTLGAGQLRPATAEEVRAAGAVPGYASPIGLPPDTLVVADEELPGLANLVAGANETGFHLLNTNIPRDYKPSIVADIAMLPEEADCARCGDHLAACRGIQVSTPWPGGIRGVTNAGAVSQDREGRSHPVRVAGIRFNTARVLEAVAGAWHDGAGLRMPPAVSPFDIHVVSLGGPATEAMVAAERLTAELEGAGVRVLFNDREESAGVKFADADLIGAPLRVTVSARALSAGGVELKRRDADERAILPLASALARITGLLAHPPSTPLPARKGEPVG